MEENTNYFFVILENFVYNMTMKKKEIKKLIQNYFHLPPTKLKCKMKLSKFSFEKIEVETKNPTLFLVPKVAEIDEYLTALCIKTPFVFFEEKVVSKIINNQITKAEYKKLLEIIKKLAKEDFSFALIPYEYPTIFGDNEKLSKEIIKLIYETKLDIKWLTFPNEYFAVPMWANKPRLVKFYANQQIKLSNKSLEDLTDKEIQKTVQNLTPSSASSYTKKFPLSIQSNNTAEGLEKLVYCCPHCNELFSIYSEYSCLKCKSCGNIIELDKNGEILFCSKIKNYDEIENYLYTTLVKKDFSINQIIQYNDIYQILCKNCKKTTKININLQVFAEKIIITNSKTKEEDEYSFENMESIDLSFDNTLIIKTKNAKQIILQGKNNENFLILKHLLKLNKN